MFIESCVNVFYLKIEYIYVVLKAGSDFEFLTTGSSSFHMCAPFTTMELLKTVALALETYKSLLSFDRVVLVEMFEIGVNNAYI